MIITPSRTLLVFRAVASGEKLDDLPLTKNTVGDITPLWELRIQRPKIDKLFIAWQGTISPQGLNLPNGQVAGVRGGDLLNDRDRTLGHYHWLEKAGGPKKDRYQMVVLLTP